MRMISIIPANISFYKPILITYKYTFLSYIYTIKSFGENRTAPLKTGQFSALFCKFREKFINFWYPYYCINIRFFAKFFSFWLSEKFKKADVRDPLQRSYNATPNLRYIISDGFAALRRDRWFPYVLTKCRLGGTILHRLKSETVFYDIIKWKKTAERRTRTARVSEGSYYETIDRHTCSAVRFGRLQGNEKDD